MARATASARSAGTAALTITYPSVRGVFVSSNIGHLHQYGYTALDLPNDHISGAALVQVAMVYFASLVFEFAKMSHRGLHWSFESNERPQSVQAIADALGKFRGLLGSLGRKFNSPYHGLQVVIYWLPVNAALLTPPARLMHVWSTNFVRRPAALIRSQAGTIERAFCICRPCTSLRGGAMNWRYDVRVSARPRLLVRQGSVMPPFLLPQSQPYGGAP
ncbi:hypothetical protein NY78_0468 [Desulfovibrio sp. TomC]|nr:hypothetical protein NY78_0468 [Desulfovibrio sp. TomC]